MSSDVQQTAELSRQIGQQLRSLAGQAMLAMEGDVDKLISHAIRDEQQIEYLLDHLLDFCYDESVLCLFKRLCRYYYTFHPVGAACYVHAYREMWDTPDETSIEVNHD